MSATLNIRCNATPFDVALDELTALFHRSPEAVERFLQRIDCQSQLVRIDFDAGSAMRAGDCWIVFQPSDLLAEFLAASRTG